MNRLVKVMAVALCVMTVMLSAVSTAFAFSLSDFDLGGIADKATPDEAKVYRDESVYVIAGADGSVDRIIVSDWIQNRDHAPALTEGALLENLENVKGDETYVMNSDGMREWNMDGKDLYLQGDGTAPLPVELRLSYTLDGKAIAPQDLAGKSGRVTIRFDYENRRYEYVEIDGQKQKIYVPFVMLSGCILDSERFSDVAVENGKVISDGERTIVAGFAMPGLDKNLGIDDVDLPDYVKITADVEDFQLGTTVTIATSGIFNNLNTDNLDSLDGIKDSLSDLTGAMDALTDGSSKLYEGLATLLEKSGELSEGVDALASGAQSLSDGAAQLSDGSVQIDAGMLDLSQGLSTLSSNNSALRSGSKTTFNAILKTAHDALVEQGLDVPTLTPSNYAATLQNLIDSLDEETVREQAEAVAKQQVTAAVEANRDAVKSAVTDAVRENVRAQVVPVVRENVTAAVLQSMGYTVDEYSAAVAAGLVDEATQAAVSAAIDSQMETDAVQSQIETSTDAQMNTDAVQALITSNTDAKIAELIEQNMQSDEVQAGIAAAVEKAKAGAQSISSLKKQLDSYNTFDAGITTYTGGVSSAAKGAGRLKSATTTLSGGAKKLSSGAKELLGGILTMKDGVPQLVSGVSQLKDGSMQLSEGLTAFNEQGISKITDLLGGDLSTLSARLRATVDVSRNYKNYTGAQDGIDGEVKFIYKTDEIK